MNYIQGVIKHITFYNDDNAYAIVKITVTDTNIKRGLFEDDIDMMTVTGYFPKPTQGEEYRFFGDKTYHEKYGEQFAASSYEKMGHTNIAGITDYLASDLFKGIGEKTAERIVDTLGEEAIQKILDDPQALDDVPKLQEKHKKTLVEGLIEHKASEQSLIKLYGYGISSKMAMRIINTYKEESVAKVETNPYRLIYDVEGIGFERADIIAKQLGFKDDDPKRINALMVYVFQDAVLQQGHTYIDKDEFLTIAHQKLNKEVEAIDSTIIIKELEKLLTQKLFGLRENHLTLSTVKRAEDDITEKLKHLTQTTQTIDKQKVYKLISVFEKEEGIVYTSKQRNAILQALTQQTLIVTGGPGTGKTTVIKGLIFVYYRYHDLVEPREDQSSLIHLIAPTGRAAKRMQESTGIFATTIHRFLGYAFDGSFQHNKYNPVEGNLFIVDESSMIDIFLAAQLMQSLPDYANLVFVGDDAQLPSVGPGQVFKDLIDSKTIPTVTLDVIHRQAKDSHIIDLAEHMRKGELPDDLLVVYNDRYVFKEYTRNFQPRLNRIIDYMIEQDYDLIDDIQVLIPMYKGSVGIDETNRFLQETYNKSQEAPFKHGDREFRINDKVLQLTNQIEDGVMNGDQGRVKHIDHIKNEIIVDFMDNLVTYKSKDLIHLRLAYAMSIHKAQGSEYKVVILPLFKSYSIMLKRKLIYTAITRAKERVVILGDIEKLSYAVKVQEESRNTDLLKQLKGTLKIAIKTQTKRTEAPLPLKQVKEDTGHPIHDESIPFDSLGETLNGKTPYDFLTKDEKQR